MKTRIISLMALASGLAASLAVAQSTPPVLINNITQIWVSDGKIDGFFTINSPGTNYSTAFPPVVNINGGGGTGATATAVIDDASGTVVGINLVTGGSGYIGDPNVTITGGFNTAGTLASSGATVTGYLNFPAANRFTAPFQNEVYGPAGMTIAIWSLASGTHPAAGFVYDITVNGLSVGQTTPAAPPGTPAGAPWTPPLPGVYSIVSTTTDGNGNTGVSAAIRYFAIGTAIVSPESGGTPPANGGQGGAGPGTLVPVGSSIVVQATSTPQDGFVSRIDFYTDWNNGSSTGVLIGSAKNYPYSVIYTPAGPAGTTHLVKARAFDNNGALVPASATMDQVNLTMATPNPAPLPTCVIVTPANNSLIVIPSSSGSGIPVVVSAGAAPGGGISKVELYINGVLLATNNVYPYTFAWKPTVTGIFTLTALAYDNLGNVVASTTSTTPTNTPAPTTVTIESTLNVAITSPTTGGSLNAGVSASLQSVVTDTNLDQSGNPATITQVQFFQDGRLVGTAPTPSSGNTYQVTFLPIQNVVGGVIQASIITAVASDNLGFSGTSQGISVAVNSSGSSVFGTSIVSPAASNVPVGSSIEVSASSTAATGSVQRVDFYTDWNNSSSTGTKIATSYSSPYSIIYTPAGPTGAVHLLKALAYDNNGNLIPGIGTSDEVTLTMITPVSGGLPTCSIVTPSTGSLIEIPDYLSNANASIPVIVAAGTTATGTISKVELYVGGTLIATDTVYPYLFSFKPVVTGVYALTALAYDNHSNVIASSTSGSSTNIPGPTIITVEAAPTVAIISPGNGGTLNSGATTSIQAIATDTNLDANGNPITISQVQFFQDGIFVGVASTPTSGNVYSVTFRPVQNIVNGFAAPSQLKAIATDTAGFTGISPQVQVNVTSGGTGSNVIIGTPPSVTLTAPADQVNVIVNSPVKFSAKASAPNGNIASVSFLVDNTVVATQTQYPYSTSYVFQNLGTYQIVAQVVDNVGDKTSTPAITVIVVSEPPPTVSITAPSSGGIVTTASGVTVTATASSPSGTITSVQFFENNLPIGTATSPPYTASFTPLSSGVYTLTAIATDNAGEQTASAPAIVEAVALSGGLGTSIYFGNYQGVTGDPGRFAFVVVDGVYGTYISHSISTAGPATTAFYTDLRVGTGGNFSAANLNGTASVTGVAGSLLPSQALFIGAASNPSGQSVASGYYTGNLGGQAGSSIAAIVGADGSIMLYVSSGSYSDVGDGSVDSTGEFTITTVDNNTLTGKVDPATGFLTGTLSGSPGGSLLAARVSGGTFSDGVLKNLSTRGYVGTGGNVMIAGFVVGGTSPKMLLIRAIGPTLSTFGLSNAIPSTQLQIYSGGTVVASNTGWSSTPANATAVANAEPTVGAFALPAGSADSALVGTFAPGSYTAMIQGQGGATGVALVEAYDLDTYSPFTSKKLINVSTRGTVGSGTNVMIGGFLINGAAPKRLLIRGAGPGLTALGVSGALASPHLQLINSSTQAIIRENYSWQMGNDAGLVTAAEQVTGAFPYANGSADSAILIVLPPGTYTAVLSGTGSSTGTALTEVYEVP